MAHQSVECGLIVTCDDRITLIGSPTLALDQSRARIQEPEVRDTFLLKERLQFFFLINTNLKKKINFLKEKSRALFNIGIS